MAVGGLRARVRVHALCQDQLQRTVRLRGASGHHPPQGAQGTGDQPHTPSSPEPTPLRSWDHPVPANASANAPRTHPGDHAAIEAGQPGIVRRDLLLHHPAGKRLREPPRPPPAQGRSPRCAPQRSPHPTRAPSTCQLSVCVDVPPTTVSSCGSRHPPEGPFQGPVPGARPPAVTTCSAPRLKSTLLFVPMGKSCEGGALPGLSSAPLPPAQLRAWVTAASAQDPMDTGRSRWHGTRTPTWTHTHARTLQGQGHTQTPLAAPAQLQT